MCAIVYYITLLCPVYVWKNLIYVERTFGLMKNCNVPEGVETESFLPSFKWD